jgi:Zn-dependent metalloprotease
MQNIHQPLCSVIPPHILRNVAQKADEETSAHARDTLDQMRELADARERIQAQAVAIPAPPKRRNVYDAQHQQALPGRLVMNEHRRRGTDVEVNEAYDGSGTTYDFYREVYGRNSFDGRGGRIDSSVHYGRGFDNALWDGTQMIYGDGDGKLFTRFTAALDVIGHELTHGVTQHTAALGYRGETGALNEHLSDAFGIMVKQRALGLGAGQSDWLIGAGLFAPGVHGKGVRSMAAPGTAYDDPVLGRDPQPAHMRDYVQTADDNGGIHINSGIPNHAFYLAAVALGGETWRVLGTVWFVVLTSNRLRPNAAFRDFVTATVAVAGELYGAGETAGASADSQGPSSQDRGEGGRAEVARPSQPLTLTMRLNINL